MKILLIAIFSLTAWAQTLDINLDALSAKAKKKAEITLEGSALTQALHMAPDKLKGTAGNISRVFVRNYEFDKPGQYSDADLESVRKQVSNGSGWSRIVNTKEEHESVEIYMFSQDGKPGGLLLIAAEEKELSVVHVVGSIDLASLTEVVNSTIKYDLKNAGGQ
jgi:Domain of unknown function (DUF4252)